MPKKRTETQVVEEAPVIEKKAAESKQSNGSNTYDVAPAFEKYSSFLLAGGVVIPVEDGKVTIASDKVVAKLREGGFIK